MLKVLVVLEENSSSLDDDIVSEDNQLVLLESVMKRAGLTATSFVFSTFSNRLGGGTSGMLH